MFVYLLLSCDSEGNEFHKIGITKGSVSRRCKSLQTGNSNKISVLKKYKSQNYKKIENWLHRKYNSFKTEANNEWFKLTNEQVLSFIKDCKEIDDTIEMLLKNNHFYN